jgi:DNA-directed RNA polymerase subunit E'/Rpb7
MTSKSSDNIKEISNDNLIKKSSQIKISNVHSPYINTTLVCPIMLYPNQIDNKLYLHVKTNLSNKLIGKCFKNYGYISKIFKIDEISDGTIEAEDPICSIKFIVKFSCKLCYPIKNKEIIFKIDRMNKALIGGVNGPLRAIITPDKINKDKFYADNNRNIRIRGSSNVILPDMYIRVLVLSSSFGDYDTNIIVIGFLQDIATQEEFNIFKEDNDI